MIQEIRLSVMQGGQMEYNMMQRIAGGRFNSDMRKIEKLSCNSDTGEISSKKMPLGYFLKSSRLIVSIP